VFDHQVVSLEYGGGATASFTMTAFTDYAFRQTKIFGTHGCLEGNGREVGAELPHWKRERHLIEGSSEHDRTPAAAPAWFEPSLRLSPLAGPRTIS
jgi:predicted dehydrogenase